MNSTGALATRAISTQELTDRFALQHLLAAYCHGIDRRDYALLRSLYHDNATDDHRPYFEGTAQAYIDWLPSMLDTWQNTVHSIFNALFIIDGEYAEGESQSRAWHRTLDGKMDFIAWGRYLDRFEKREGVWRFMHRSLVLDYSEELAVKSNEADALQGIAMARPGADDPVYQQLGLFEKDRSTRG